MIENDESDDFVFFVIEQNPADIIKQITTI